jgi:hypothetical protein
LEQERMMLIEMTLTAKARFWAKPALLAAAVACALVEYVSERAAAALSDAAANLIGAYGFTFEAVEGFGG